MRIRCEWCDVSHLLQHPCVGAESADDDALGQQRSVLRGWKSDGGHSRTRREARERPGNHRVGEGEATRLPVSAALLLQLAAVCLREAVAVGCLVGCVLMARGAACGCDGQLAGPSEQVVAELRHRRKLVPE